MPARVTQGERHEQQKAAGCATPAHSSVWAAHTALTCPCERALGSAEKRRVAEALRQEQHRYLPKTPEVGPMPV